MWLGGVCSEGDDGRLIEHEPLALHFSDHPGLQCGLAQILVRLADGTLQRPPSHPGQDLGCGPMILQLGPAPAGSEPGNQPTRGHHHGTGPPQ